MDTSNQISSINMIAIRDHAIHICAAQEQYAPGDTAIYSIFRERNQKAPWDYWNMEFLPISMSYMSSPG